MAIREITIFETGNYVKTARWTEEENEVFFIEVPRKAYNVLIPIAFIYRNGCMEKLRTLKYIGSPLRILIYFDGQKYYVTKKGTLYVADRPEEVVRILHPDSYDWVKECDPIVLFTELSY